MASDRSISGKLWHLPVIFLLLADGFLFLRAIVLNWFETNFFAFWLIVKSSGWILFVKLWGTMSNSHLFSKHKGLTSSLSWPLKVSLMMSENCSCEYPSSIFFVRRYSNIIFANKSTHFSRFYQCFSVCVTLTVSETLREKCPYSELFWSDFPTFGPE